jgi:predicted transcriptional regulator
MTRRKEENELRTAVITIRVRPSLRQRLEKLAHKQRRSLSSLLEIFLEQIVDKEGNGQPK